MIFIAFRLAMIQPTVGKDKAKNIQRACQMVRNAAQKGANMVVLPVRYLMSQSVRRIYSSV